MMDCNKDWVSEGQTGTENSMGKTGDCSDVMMSSGFEDKSLCKNNL